MTSSSTLILGAGASWTYGYPTGKELRIKILEIEHDMNAFSEIAHVGIPTIRDFLNRFRLSSASSIDTFLSRNAKFDDVGKAAIAKVLYSCESINNLYAEDSDKVAQDNWYSYLLNTLANCDEWKSFDPSWLTIITFNYDRSLEYFLSTSLQNMYGKSADEVNERLKSLKIVHVYGDLGVDKLDSFGYGQALTDDDSMHNAICLAKQKLQIMHEGRDDEIILNPIRDIIKNADKIGFLGFGFDRINVSRILDTKIIPFLTNPKNVVATTLGMTRAEVSRVKDWLFHGNNLDDVKLAKFLHENCLGILRETLILEP